jgi:hypothetical protein
LKALSQFLSVKFELHREGTEGPSAVADLSDVGGPTMKVALEALDRLVRILK